MAARKTKEEKAVDAEWDALISAFRHVATSPEGRKVLRYIMGMTGYKSSFIHTSKTSGELNVHAQTWLLAQREIWIEIQKLLPATLLPTIEYQEERNG